MLTSSVQCYTSHSLENIKENNCNKWKKAFKRKQVHIVMKFPKEKPNSDICTITTCLDAFQKFNVIFLWEDFPLVFFGSGYPHLNPTIVTMVSMSPNIEIMDPTMVKSSRALLSVRPTLRALISCKVELTNITYECWNSCHMNLIPCKVFKLK